MKTPMPDMVINKEIIESKLARLKTDKSIQRNPHVFASVPVLA